MKKIISFILVFIIIILLIINVFSIFNISFLGFRIYKIGSGSMEPYLNVNDIVIIKEVDSYNAGDVVTYKDEDSTVTHRIVLIDNNKIITKGDANNVKDKAITKDDILGKLFIRITGVGFINYLLSHICFWIILFIVGLIITILIPDKKERN